MNCNRAQLAFKTSDGSELLRMLIYTDLTEIKNGSAKMLLHLRLDYRIL